MVAIANIDAIKSAAWEAIPAQYRQPNKKGHTPSIYQARLYWAAVETAENIVCNAVAGSGKTSSIEGIVNLLPPTARILVVAFNVKIKDALARIFKGRKNVTVKTLNGFGFGVCARNVRSMGDPEPDKVYKTLKYRFFPDLDSEDKDAREEAQKKLARYSGPITQLIGLLRHRNIQSFPDREVIEQLADRHEIVLPNGDSGEDFWQILEACYSRVIKNLQKLDWDDQVFQPIFQNWSIQQYDFVIVDESQDLSPIQQELCIRAANYIGRELRSSKRQGRMIFVGDRNQAIYGFRGADVESIDNIIKRIDAAEMPLSICYRCPKAAIRRAQKIVPQIEAAPNAIEGIDEDIKLADFRKLAQPGAFVLCRTTAPLVAECLLFIREGKRAFVYGRDIGRNLAALADNIYGAYIKTGLPMGDRIEKYREEKGAKLAAAKRESELQSLNDRCDTLLSILSTCDNDIRSLKKAIEALFSDEDEKGAVVFSTMHKAKGLEREYVYILCPELLPHPNAKQPWQIQQEKNLEYVAYTRTLYALYIVHGKPGEREEKAAAPKSFEEQEAEAEMREREQF